MNQRLLPFMEQDPLLYQLREQLQEDIILCIKGYVGRLTHPVREKLMKDLCQVVTDRINERIENK
jgi:hypothetical protein